MSRRTVVAIGIFDGVHRGHQAILKYAVRRAKRVKAVPAALTFYPHPAAIVAPVYTPQLLLSLPQRLEEFQKHGIQRPEVLKFTRTVSHWTPEQFVRNVIVRRLNACEVVVGHDFGFGHKRSGNIQVLKQFGRRYGFSVHVVPPVRRGGKRVASRLVRELIAAGKLKMAWRYLGIPPRVTGRVVKGAGRGKKFGIPTANVQVEFGVLPPEGVYAVWGRWSNGSSTKTLPGVANLGIRPTVDCESRTPILEVHLFGRIPPLRGKSIEVFFGKHLRAEKKFSAVSSLIQQIQRDCQRAKHWHKSHKVPWMFQTVY